MRIFEYPLTTGITRTKEFERKRLATHAVNVGVRCGHECTYCSTPSLLRMHPAFKALGLNPFDRGYAIMDPTTPERVARDAQRITKRGVVQLCTTVDAWSPEAQKFDLGRKCLEAILAQPGWTVRILTKNAAITRDFDLIERHRDRVLVSLSITATASREGDIRTIEPNASPLAERMAALQEAHRRGLRTYAMLCPLLPKIAGSAEDVDELVRFAVACGAEEIFAEPVNPRGPGLRMTQGVLADATYHESARAIAGIRQRRNWSSYVVGLINNIQRSVRSHADIKKLRILLYPAGLTAEDEIRIRQGDAGVIWLGKHDTRTASDDALR